MLNDLNEMKVKIKLWNLIIREVGEVSNLKSYEIKFLSARFKNTFH